MKARDLVIIGGGAGGLVVASVAGQLGLRESILSPATGLFQTIYPTDHLVLQFLGRLRMRLWIIM